MTKQQVAQVFFERGVARILRLLLLTNYTVTLEYERGLKSTMEVDTDHTYLTAEIAYGNKAVDLFMDNPDEAFECLVHECMHILTSKLSDGRKGLSAAKYLEVEEATTEHLAKAFHKLMRRV